jgi:hypothetical protein
MKVSPHQVMDVWTDGTGTPPEAVVVLVVGAVAAAATVAALQVADLVSRYRTPPRLRA